MIRVSQPGVGGPKVFTSQAIEHPYMTGHQNVSYTINHDLGEIPDLITLHTTGDFVSSTQGYKVMYASDQDGASTWQGPTVFSSSKTQFVAKVFNLGITGGIYFKAIYLGGSSRESL